MATPQTLVKDIMAGRFKPAYYFYGEEDYRIAEAEKFVTQQFLPDRQQAANCIRIDSRQTKPAELAADLASLPMLGDKQVFLIREFQTYRPNQLEQLLRYLTPADPHRIVVFSSPSARLPKKGSAFLKQMAQLSEMVEFKRLSFGEASAVVRAKLAASRLAISPEAAKALVELCGGSRGRLDSELAKLINYARPDELIGPETVLRLCTGHELHSIFDLSDAIVDGNAGQTISQIRQLVAEGTPPSTLLALIHGHIVALYLVKSGKGSLGRREFLRPKFQQQASRFQAGWLEAAIIAVAEADAQLRNAAVPPQLTLEALALSLVNQKRKSAATRR